MRRALSILMAVSGWAVLYVTAGSLLGWAFGPQTPERGCLPYISIFGVLESKCDNPSLHLMWSVVVGWPRLVVVFPSMAAASVRAFFKSGYYLYHLGNGIPFDILSIPIALALWASTAYWMQWSKVFAFALLSIFLGQVIFLGLALL